MASWMPTETEDTQELRGNNQWYQLSKINHDTLSESQLPPEGARCSGHQEEHDRVEEAPGSPV